MRVTTDIPCGNGRVRMINPDHYEIELIWYCKAARYVLFQIDQVSSSRVVKIVLKPDSLCPERKFKFSPRPKIWKCDVNGGKWDSIPDEQVDYTFDKIEFDLKLEESSCIQISTESPRPYAETCVELSELVHGYPSLASMYVIGSSIEHRPLLLVRVADDIHINGVLGSEKRPRILITSGQHATEFAGEEISRGMLQAVLEENEIGRELRKRYIFDFILVSNPDGNYHGWHQYNARDWANHNYNDGVDRSWHHEFITYFLDRSSDVSPETKGIGDWILQTEPQLIIDNHSWEGHNGACGTFTTDTNLLPPKLAEIFNQLNSGAKKVGTEFDMNFDVCSRSTLKAEHLSDYMIFQRDVPVYTVEGHMYLGREKLQAFGKSLIQEWLVEADLKL